MSEVKVREGESLESALKRFKKKTARAGVMSEVRKREHYEKPSERKREKRKLQEKEKQVLDSYGIETNPAQRL